MNNNLKQDVLCLLGRHYMLVVEKYCDMLKNRDNPIEDIMDDFKTELMFVDDTEKEVQNLTGRQSNNQVPWTIPKSIDVEQTIRSLIAMAERNCVATFNCDDIANCDECPFYNSEVEFSCYEAYPADYWRAMLKDYISKQPLHKLISRKEFFALVDARDYVPEPLHSALYRICEKYESEK